MIGQLVAAFRTMLWGLLFDRQVEKLKSEALKKTKGDFEGLTTLTQKTERELDWWIDQVEHGSHPLTYPEVL